MHLSNWAPFPDFIGLLLERQFFSSQISLSFLVYLLIKSLGKWVLL